VVIRRGEVQPGQRTTVVLDDGARQEIRNEAFKTFMEAFAPELIMDKRTSIPPMVEILNQWEANLYSEGTEMPRFNVFQLGVATHLATMFDMAFTEESWNEEIERARQREDLYIRMGKIGIASMYGRDQYFLNLFRDFMLKARKDVETTLIYGTLAYTESLEYQESVDQLNGIMRTLRESPNAPNPFFITVWGRNFTRIRVSPAWRYGSVEEMFELREDYGVDVKRRHFLFARTPSIYDLTLPLYQAGLFEWRSTISDGGVPNVGETPTLAVGNVITTVGGHTFQVERTLSIGETESIYEALTLFYNRPGGEEPFSVVDDDDELWGVIGMVDPVDIQGLIGIPSKVILKVSTGEQFHETLVHLMVEEKRKVSLIQPALTRYYDFAYIAGIHIMVVEDLKGEAVSYDSLNPIGRSLIDDAEIFVSEAIGVRINNARKPFSIMTGPRTDTRNKEMGVYLVDLSPF